MGSMLHHVTIYSSTMDPMAMKYSIFIQMWACKEVRPVSQEIFCQCLRTPLAWLRLFKASCQCRIHEPCLIREGWIAQKDDPQPEAFPRGTLPQRTGSAWLGCSSSKIAKGANTPILSLSNRPLFEYIYTFQYLCIYNYIVDSWTVWHMFFLWESYLFHRHKNTWHITVTSWSHWTQGVNWSSS